MMRNYTLNNWDGKLSNADQQTTQNSTKGGSNTWESRSHMLSSPSGHSKARNDAPIPDNEMMDQTAMQTYIEAMADINNDSCNGSLNTRVPIIQDTEAILSDAPSVDIAKATVTNDRRDASSGSQNTTRTFMPIENSLLHAFHSHKSPTSPQLAKKLEAVLLARHPPHPKKNIDGISVYTTDANGEIDDEDDEDANLIQRLLISPSKLNESPSSRASSPCVHNSLFTPPPSEGYPTADHLFTPEPPSHKPAPSSKRERMMYVDVPSLVGPKSEYRYVVPRRMKKPRARPPVPAVKIFPTLQDALQASIDNNSHGALSRGRSKTTAKIKNKKENQENSRIAIAGSSKHPIVLDSVSNDGTVRVSSKKRTHKEDETMKNATKKQKRTHVDIDLTLSDGANQEAKPKLKLKLPPLKVKAANVVPAHNKENDVTLLALGVVKPIDLEIWDLNTRFLRTSIMQQRRSSSNASLLAEPTPLRKAGISREMPWLFRPPLTSEEDEISLGGTIPTSWDVASGGVFEESDDEDVIFVEPSQVHQQHTQPQSLPLSAYLNSTPRTLPIPRKIDLAARYRKKDKPESKSTSTVNKSPVQSFSQGLKPISPSTSLAVQSHYKPVPYLQGQLATKANPPHVQSKESDLLSPSTPSAKALGKRKAVDPEPCGTNTPSRLPLRTFGFPSSHEQPDFQLNNHTLEHFRKPNLDIFMHDYGPFHSSLLRSANTYGDAQMLSSLYTASQSHDTSILQSEHAFAPTSEGFLSTEIDLDGSLGVLLEHINPWDLGVGRDEEYQYSTIDPTLLRGSSMDPEPEISEPLPDYTGDFATSDNESENSRERNSEDSRLVSVSRSNESAFGPIAGPSGIRNRSPSSSPSILYFPSSTENTSEKEYVPSETSTFDRPKRKKQPDSMSSSDDEPLANWAMHQNDTLLRRKKNAGFVALQDETSSDKEYVPSTKSSLVLDPVPKRKTRRASSPSFEKNISKIELISSTTPAVQSAPKETQRQPSVEAVRSLPKRQRIQRQREDFIALDAFLTTDGSDSTTLRNPNSLSKPARKVVGSKTEIKRLFTVDWPKEATELYCHQCRNKTDRLKMTCPSCQTKFCVRCLTLRYPDKRFFEASTLVWTGNCPRCGKYCSCTSCCVKRGEQYVPARAQWPPGKRIAYSSMLQDQTLPLVPLAIPENVQYWATVYDLNGKRVGTTYAPSSGTVLPSVVFARPTTEPGTTTSRKIPSKRIFVGSVQRSWRVSEHLTIRDVNPLPPPKPTRHAKGKKIVKVLPNVRHFVGSNNFIKYHKKPDPYDPFGDLSSLSSLTSDDDENDTPEEPETDVEVFNPESLTDSDICRAITLGLQACGLKIVNGPTHTLITSL